MRVVSIARRFGTIVFLLVGVALCFLWAAERASLKIRSGKTVFGQQTGSSASDLVDALRDGSANPRSLASADLNGDVAPDLIAGYEYNGIGIVTVRFGNIEGFAPADDSVFVRMQAGYDPASLTDEVTTYLVPATPDLLIAGDFDQDGLRDVLFAAHGGNLHLLKGDTNGRLALQEPIDLPGPVSAISGGEFGAADGRVDLAVGVSTPDGDELLVFDGARGLEKPMVALAIASSATAIEFAEVDGDPFGDIAVANGRSVDLIHGWGRKVPVDVRSRVERVVSGDALVSIAVDDFLWDRQGALEIATLADDGSVSLFSNSRADDRPYSDQELAERVGLRGRIAAGTNRNIDVESLPSWPLAANAANSWRKVRQIVSEIDTRTPLSSQRALAHGKLFGGESNPLLVIDRGANSVKAISQFRGLDTGRIPPDATLSGDIWTRSFSVKEAAAVHILPRKINGSQEVVVLSPGKESPEILLFPPNTTITVDRTDDPSGAALTAASACTAAGNDCSLRGALQFANLPANDNTTISLPANTYILSINGTSQGGCDGNTVGDLGANRTMSIMGAGAATTIIRQTGTGPASDGDRIMCMNEPFTIGLIYNFSAVTFVGGREGTAAGTGTALGGGGIIGGELNNSLTMTNVVMANNQETVSGSANLGGGALQITGGNLIITNSTFGGTSAPGAYGDRTSTTTGNSQAGSGGGVTYTPSSPQHAGGSGTLTITGSTFSRNTAAGIGGGGADLLIFAFAAPGGIGTGSATVSTSTFSNNQASNTGGGIVVESLPTTVATTSFISNTAGNRGGGIYVGGGSLLLNGAGPSITFTGNTATNAGSSVSTAAPVNVAGTNTTIGGDIEISTGGTWTNNVGSTLAPTNVVLVGGTFIMNNSIMNVGGNMTIGPAPVVGSTFNGNTGTVNIAGNLTMTAGGTPATSFNGGTGTFNFNGTGAQSITAGFLPTFGSLTDSNTNQLLTINNNIAVNGTLTVNANTMLAPVAGAVISGTGTLTGSGTARVTRTAATADFLSQYTITNKTLTNLLVDYVGASAQVLSPITYGPLRINNGSGVSITSGTATVNSLLTLTAGALGVGNSTLVINNGTSVSSGSITSNPTGTVNYNQGTPGQDVRAFNYGNLIFSNQNKVLAGTGTIGISGTFTPGTAVGHVITGSTINFNGTGGQTIPAFSYNNFTISGARGANNVTLANGGTIGVAGLFSPTATFAGGMYVIANNTVDFNGAGSQTIPAFSYNNLTSSNAGARTLAGAGTIGIAAVFTPGANSYTVTGSTVNFNGTVAQNIPAFNYNHLTSSSTGTRTLPNGGTVGVAGNFTPGTNLYTVTGSTIDFNGSGSQAIPGFNYNNLTSSNVGARTLTNGATIGIANVFTPGSNTYTVTGNTVDFNGSVGQSIPAFNYNNLTSSSTGARTLPNGGTVGIAGLFAPGTNVYTITGSTVEYNGAALQTLPATFTTYNNLTINNPAGATGFAGLNVLGLLRIQAGTFTTSSNFNNVQIDVGAILNANAGSMINVTGNWVNNGIFNGNTGTVNLIGAAPQSIGGSFSNMTVNNATGVNLSGPTTVNATLNLTSGALNVGSNSLTLNSTVTGASGLTSNADGTVNYNQSSNGQNVLAAQYGHLTFSNFAKILPNGGTVGIAGNFTTGAAGGHTVTGSTIAFNGTSLQTLPAFTPYNNLTVNNAPGIALGSSVTVDGILTLTSGNITTGANTLSIGANGSTSRTSGHVIGNLQKNFAGPGPMFEMPVGTAGAFSPLHVTVTNGSGQLSARANTGMPVVTPVGLDPAKTLQRYWTLSGSGIRSNITFNYLDGDIPATPGTENLWNIIRVTGNVAVRYAPTLPYVLMDPANNRFTMSDLETYSDWTAGEPLAPTAANVNVSGRVVDVSGRGISGVQMTMQDQAGTVLRAITNSFGFYTFTSVQVGHNYLIIPRHRRYEFESRTVAVNEDLTGVDFVAEP